jgi:hypothetical protein
MCDRHDVAGDMAGNAIRVLSFGLGWYSITDSSAAATRLRWVSIAPFGNPVVPLV